MAAEEAAKVAKEAAAEEMRVKEAVASERVERESKRYVHSGLLRTCKIVVLLFALLNESERQKLNAALQNCKKHLISKRLQRRQQLLPGWRSEVYRPKHKLGVMPRHISVS